MFIIEYIPVSCDVFVYVIDFVACFVYYDVLVVIINNDVQNDLVIFPIPPNIFHTVIYQIINVIIHIPKNQNSITLSDVLNHFCVKICVKIYFNFNHNLSFFWWYFEKLTGFSRFGCGGVWGWVRSTTRPTTALLSSKIFFKEFFNSVICFFNFLI